MKEKTRVDDGLFENITLEMSLKPFKKTDAAYIKAVCEGLFEQWKPLVKTARQVSVLLWCADGSELLDYRGVLDDAFEWCYFLGGANQRENHPKSIDPEGKGLHTRNYLYIQHPPRMTYRILKEIIEQIKAAGKKVLGKTVFVGETVDPGPEFALSDFKYNRHNEICLGEDMGKGTMICAHACLKGDHVHYAGFPDGIPDGLPFGTFLGRQAQIFLQELGFDYLWLSNGLGFGRETWSAHGAVFDGKRFDADGLEHVKQDVLDFWQQFRAECPDFPVQTRGTNMSAGIDMASDGVPLAEIYKNAKRVLPPPNSPWAALNFDFGLELMGHMSRIAELPEDEFMFRYYIHDPWWVNSPWYDRYGGQPHDIYLPAAVSRIDEEGRVGLPAYLNLLSVDNSYGDMPESCVYEPLPHLLKAKKDAPDAVSPLVWVYPFQAYGAAKSAAELAAMYSGDWFVRGAINCGLPLNQVISCDNFARLKKEIFRGSVVVTPVPFEGSREEENILDYVTAGGKVIFYGNIKVASERFRTLFGLKLAEEIVGEMEITVNGTSEGALFCDEVRAGGGLNAVFCRREQKGAGRPLDMAETGSGEILDGMAQKKRNFAPDGTNLNGLLEQNSTKKRRLSTDCEVIGKSSDAVCPRVFAEACGRVIGVQSGNAVWVQSITSERNAGPEDCYPCESLMVYALRFFDMELSYSKKRAKPPVTTVHRHDNAYILSAYTPDTTVETRIKTPLGAPVLMGYETEIDGQTASYRFPKAEHRECRAFIVQNGGTVGAREVAPVSAEFRRRIEIRGLNHATVRLFGELYCKENITCVLNSEPDFYFVGDTCEGMYVTDEHGTYYEIHNVTGTLVFSMPKKEV